MATNPTNSTSVNITSLPKAQLAVPTDFLVLQTNNGTQIVSFSSFNVVKTDINGNATIVGSVTGNAAQFTNTRVTSISSSGYFTSNGTPGITLPVIAGREYYDSFTIKNGLITSAVATSVDYQQNPIYTSLLTQLTAASANLATTGIFDRTTTVSINSGSNSGSGSISGLLTTLAVAATDFTIMPFNGLLTTSTNLSCVPYIYITQQPTTGNGYQVTFTLFAGGTLTQNVTYGVRLLKTY